MKKILTICMAVFTALILFVACAKKGGENESILEGLKNIDSYTSDVTIDIKNDRQTVKYSGKQYYIKNKGYRFDLGEERIFIYNGDNIYVKDLKNNTQYITENSFDEVFKIGFINECVKLIYTNEELKIKDNKTNDKNYKVVNLILPGNNKSLYEADLYINSKGIIPEYLKIYDSKHNEVIMVTYKNFNKNEEIKEEIMKK